jgi:hypothetical protein
MDAEQLSSLAQAERFKWEKALEAELWTARIDVHMPEQVRLPLPTWTGPSALTQVWTAVLGNSRCLSSS